MIKVNPVIRHRIYHAFHNQKIERGYSWKCFDGHHRTLEQPPDRTFDKLGIRFRGKP